MADTSSRLNISQKVVYIDKKKIKASLINKLNKKHQEVLMGLWHDASVELAVASLGYHLKLPKELEGAFEAGSFIKKLNPNFKPELGNYDMLVECGNTFAECEKSVNEKYIDNETVILGWKNQYIGFWPFGYKGVKILALTQKKEK